MISLKIDGTLSYFIFMKKILLVVVILIIALLHYCTPISLHHMHAFYQRLYYVPIIIGAYWFGLKSGIPFSVLAALSYLPHIIFQWSAHPDEAFTQYVEIAMFFMIGSLVGILSDRQRFQYKQIQEANLKISRMDRLSLLGQLAAGLAHEIRNPLGSLVGSVEILEESLGEKHPKIEFVTIMHQELNRLRDKLNEFLKFARPAPPQRIENSINDVVKAGVDLVQREAAKTSSRIETRIDETVPLVSMDAEQVKQILINLLLNSVQAMPDGGTVTVTTGVYDAGVFFSVEDDGNGVSAENREKIFDPFFSTKKDGTGLGLPIVKQLVEAMNGTVTLSDAPAGARFEVRIPNEKK